MAVTLSCPECDRDLEFPESFLGKKLRCRKCRHEFWAERPRSESEDDEDEPRDRKRSRRPAEDDDADAAPARGPKTKSRLPLILGLAGLGVLLIGGAVAAFLAFGGSGGREFADPDGVFTASFPGQPSAATTTPPQPNRWGEKVYSTKVGGITYSVEVLDPGDALGADARTPRAVLDVVRIYALRDGNGTEIDRNTDAHRGYPAEQVLFRSGDQTRATFLRTVVGGRYVLRLLVAGPMTDADKAGALRSKALAFFDSVAPGPAFGPPAK
jgi:hypothetical protein